MLRTNTDLNPLDAMLCYKHLWTVEQTFRTAKHLFATRPIFHKLDESNASRRHRALVFGLDQFGAVGSTLLIGSLPSIIIGSHLATKARDAVARVSPPRHLPGGEIPALEPGRA